MLTHYINNNYRFWRDYIIRIKALIHWSPLCHSQKNRKISMILGERMVHLRPVAPPPDEPIEGIDRMIRQRFITPLSHIYFLVDKSDSIKSYIFYLYVGNSSSFNDNK
jgi:hypothetical protein